MKIKAVPLSLVAFCAISAAMPAFGQEDEPRYSIEDVTACSKDAMRLCKDKLADIGAIEACMRSHFDELRPKCKARFSR